MKLFFRESGQGQPLIILHGLFGSSDNWFTLAKAFAESFHVYLVDQRNHGQSPHSDNFNYILLAEDLKEFIETNNIQNPVIIGHSMGGKAVMNFAVKYPDLVKEIIVVDIVPKAYPVHHKHILEGLTKMPLTEIKSRNEAEDFLSEYVQDVAERQFLLKNLVRNTEGGFAWKVNVAAINTHIEEIGEGMQYQGEFEKPSLFIKGLKSSYYKQGDEELIKETFPNAEFATIDSGHWVQAERPTEFLETVLRFIKTN
jgi:pimeloyl-ACP methyl ester carboxylesterase